MKVSALILTYNEEINIARCLSSLEGIDDVVLIDSGSTDATCSIAEQMGARVVSRPFDNFANQRNFGLETGDLQHDWVLHLDADEALTPAFREKLARLSEPQDIDGYRVPSMTMLNDQWLKRAGMYPTYQVRIGHRTRLKFKQVGHGQREDVPADRVGTFDEPYLHYNFSHGLEAWFKKHVRYAHDEAQQIQLEQGHKRSSVWSGDATERRRAIKQLVNRLPVWMRPPLRFFHVLILRKGILDGRAGLQYALMLAAYESMIASFSVSKKNE